MPHLSTTKVVIPFEYTKIWFDLFIVLALQQSTINIVLHRVFVGIRNGDILFAEDDLSAFNDFDVMEIDDEGAVSAHKPIGRQRCFYGAHRGEREDGFARAPVR